MNQRGYNLKEWFNLWNLTVRRMKAPQSPLNPLIKTLSIFTSLSHLRTLSSFSQRKSSPPLPSSPPFKKKKKKSLSRWYLLRDILSNSGFNALSNPPKYMKIQLNLACTYISQIEHRIKKPSNLVTCLLMHVPVYDTWHDGFNQSIY